MRSLLLTLFLLLSLTSVTFAQENPLETEDAFDAKELALLKKRKSMIALHEYTAWGALGFMTLAYATAPDGASKNKHNIPGYLAGALYGASAAFAYFAPKPEGTPDKKKIVWHKRLIYIHAPAMLLTALSGYKAAKDREKNKKLDSFSKAHKAFAAITTISFGLGVITSYDLTFDLIAFESVKPNGGLWKLSKNF